MAGFDRFRIGEDMTGEVSFMLELGPTAHYPDVGRDFARDVLAALERRGEKCEHISNSYVKR